MEENLVKRANQILGTTNKTLAEKLGVSLSIVDKWSMEGKPSTLGEKAINLLIENHELKSLISGEELGKLRAELQEGSEKLESLQKLGELEQENAMLKERLEKITKLANIKK